jgi:hypothetical protein
MVFVVNSKEISYGMLWHPNLMCGTKWSLIMNSAQKFLAVWWMSRFNVKVDPFLAQKVKF